jgi:hypothetical protein
MAEIRMNAPNRLPTLLGGVMLMISATLAPAASDGYQDWLRGQLQGATEIGRQYEIYRSEQDREFSSHLKSQWLEFQVFQGKVRDPRPKPKVIPAAPVVLETPPKDVPKPQVAPVKAPPPVPTPPPPTKPPELARQILGLEFYGNPVILPYDPQWRNAAIRTIDPAGLAAFWDSISATRYQPTLLAIANMRAEMHLDDWGHVALWQEVAKSLQPDHPAEQQLLLWFFLVKSGVDVRLGYSGHQVFLLIAVKQPVYAVSFIKLGKNTYYALLNTDRGKNLRSFSTYEANYPSPLQPLDLKGAGTSFTKSAPAEKRVSFDYQGHPVDIKYAYDRRLVQYMADFPQMDFELYFATQASPSAREPLLQALRQHIQGMRQEDAVNFLLAFVQKAFAYKTDQDQFGYEKYFFVEESLHYPYSDCEDRSALFAWLVRELLGLKTVGLHYPGHMTTGISLKEPQRNQSTVEWQGERFVIADPTYINASVGMAMPSYAKLQPLRIIPAQ